jgi:hypothetical protein
VISLHKDWYHYPEGERESDREKTDVPESIGA